MQGREISGRGFVRRKGHSDKFGGAMRRNFELTRTNFDGAGSDCNGRIGGILPIQRTLSIYIARMPLKTLQAWRTKLTATSLTSVTSEPVDWNKVRRTREAYMDRFQETSGS